jgi:hypothetical protein
VQQRIEGHQQIEVHVGKIDAGHARGLCRHCAAAATRLKLADGVTSAVGTVRWGTIVFLASACAATRAAPAGPPVENKAAAPSPAKTTDECGAGSLPRVTEKSLSSGGLKRFLSTAATGSLAVEWDGSRARVIEECRLDGHYSEARGHGGGRFWATNRVMFRTDEAAGRCRTATHVVAAYVTESSASGSTGEPRMWAILVPLPCPPTSDSAPAPGCLGKGMTGPQRRTKAEALMAKLDPDAARTADVAHNLEVFALIPDEHWGITYAGSLNMADCPLYEQGHWIGSQYQYLEDKEFRFPRRLFDEGRRPEPPRLVWRGSNEACIERPVFLWCFMEKFQSEFSSHGDWLPPAGQEYR